MYIDKFSFVIWTSVDQTTLFITAEKLIVSERVWDQILITTNDGRIKEALLWGIDCLNKMYMTLSC